MEGALTGVSAQIGEVVTTVPTIGFNLESVTYKNLDFNVWVRINQGGPETGAYEVLEANKRCRI